ncbi:hypothetical protein JX580_04785 [Thiomicrospira microaerophila]|uniref:hypothetical protein n=1 Tax=Thiomicrospira microaerophila TaxID=406020 RepID=UPI00200BE197|nr:hypothetical protein [Thiomicrospira microaerophila]UQB43198.1 hypothetical protein JX580_04785 [Thiomicrospira microaerophila]
MKSYILLSAMLALTFSTNLKAQESSPLVIQVESVVMGTDGQMRVRINGQYLTRHSEKDGVRVIDMDYHHVKVEARGQQMTLKPHQTLTLETHQP